ITAQKDQIFEIILNNPEKRNAIRIQLLQAVAQAVAAAENTDGIRVIILRAEGKNFSAGIDLMSAGGFSELVGENWRDHMHEVTRLYQGAIHRLQQSFLPTIALLHSFTLGAGLELALGCDLRIAADNAIFSLEEARLGMIPDGGGTARLTHLIGASRAKEFIFTGRRIDASTAEQWGLVNQVVPRDTLLEAGYKLAGEIAKSAPLAIAAAKRTINAIEDAESGFYLEMLEQAPLFHSEDLAEGLQAAMERRPANWKSC
ncbi:MAG TPA: enoyl-CoA hydratase/isomerase family protein, partial [Aggregatilineales bacterium]|nr:enoyl-CoA hydratase/isomerase family protein [Aggregatilineales bacterium]